MPRTLPRCRDKPADDVDDVALGGGGGIAQFAATKMSFEQRSRTRRRRQQIVVKHSGCDRDIITATLRPSDPGKLKSAFR